MALFIYLHQQFSHNNHFLFIGHNSWITEHMIQITCYDYISLPGVLHVTATSLSARDDWYTIRDIESIHRAHKRNDLLNEKVDDYTLQATTAGSIKLIYSNDTWCFILKKLSYQKLLLKSPQKEAFTFTMVWFT